MTLPVGTFVSETYVSGWTPEVVELVLSPDEFVIAPCDKMSVPPPLRPCAKTAVMLPLVMSVEALRFPANTTLQAVPVLCSPVALSQTDVRELQLAQPRG